MSSELEWARQELQLRVGVARAADRQLRAWGLERNECGQLADSLELLLAKYTKVQARKAKA